ncbi:LacI family DNA-binding transcriptional regulator [Microbacterium sp. ARD31]|uniref:LacI family DNA-binding transcriptional regulator n=1 Tax=Microbacterium sp. ARD31 TaxID=2962576 RepID=UPI0028816EBC|nr:LacI family DNA-binding transcriptional regulator [Microbacterium sp. ARD31]MDT0181832.1 LacI family DNA-binding transcriptional regulator [Microbacterium sp. ARD31]
MASGSDATGVGVTASGAVGSGVVGSGAAGSGARPATLRDVARVAGVSHQTVSRYLRHNGGLKPATVAAIAAAIEQLDYRPNLIARSMRTRRSGRLAILLPGAADWNPGRLIGAAVRAAHEAGFTVEVLSVEGGQDARADRARELAASGQVEGILAFAPLPADLLGAFAGTQIFASADYDDRMRTIGGLADGAPVEQLVTRLAELGHRRFAHVTGRLSYASARSRREVFVQTVERLGLEVVLVHEGDWTPASGREAIEALARLSPRAPRATAVVAANDVVAAAAIRAASERGWRVPDDLSITGWDDHVVGALLSPALTTVDADYERIGADAVARLIAAVRGDEPPAAAGAPVHRVIWRESTGPAPAP